MFSRFVRTVFISTSLAAAAFALDGENLTGRVTGKVVDQNNAAVAGARVVAVRAGTSIRVETSTDADGKFSVDIPRGEYSLTASADGFDANSTRVDIRVAELEIAPLVL